MKSQLAEKDAQIDMVQRAYSNVVKGLQMNISYCPGLLRGTNEECYMCQIGFKAGERVFKFPCNHLMHEICWELREIKMMKKNYPCDLCKDSSAKTKTD